MPPRKGAEKARIEQIIEGLKREYPDANCALDHTNAFELLIATILSAQSTDKMVNTVTPTLFKKYPDARALARAEIEDVEAIIRPTGFFHAKTKFIIGASKRLVEAYKGDVPQAMEELLTLPGVARKTANVVLGTAFRIPSGVVVDTHVRRLSQRLGLTKQEDPVKIEADLQKSIPRSEWIDFSHHLIHHGRQVCHARRPTCEECILESLCPASLLKGTTGRRKRV